MYNSKSKIFIKIISCLVAVIFFWDQIVWAADLASYNTSTITTTQNADQPSGVDLESQLERYSYESEFIEHMQSVEEFMTQQYFSAMGKSETRTADLSFNTSGGDVISYLNGKINSIEFSGDSTKLNNLILDINNEINNAEIQFSDGYTEVIENKNIVSVTTSEGIIYTYNSNQRLSSMAYSDGKNIRYIYLEDGEGGVLETKVLDDAKTAYYDGENKLEKIEYKSGEKVEYENGLITTITDAVGAVYRYDDAGLLSEIRYLGSIYYIEEKNVISIEKQDGTFINAIEWDIDGSFLNCEIKKSDGMRYTVENKMLKRVEYTDGSAVDYTYVINDEGEITSFIVSIDDNGNIKQYNCEVEISTGDIIVNDNNIEYRYGSDRKLKKVTDADGVYEHTYDENGEYSGTVFTANDGKEKESKSDSEIGLPEGTECVYYTEGEFAEKLERIILPDGNSIYYDYEITEGGNLKVYKRYSYEDNRISTNYRYPIYQDRSLNPNLKTTFTLDGKASYSYFSISASYYKANDRNTSLSVSLSGSRFRLNFYSYNYVSKTSKSFYRYLGEAIKKDVEYTTELVWQDDGVEVYIYETLSGKPDIPQYVIDDNQWDPKFSVYGTNSKIDILSHPMQDFNMNTRSAINYSVPLKENPFHKTEVTFNEKALSKNIYYNLYASTSDFYVSTSLSHYGERFRVSYYHWDRINNVRTSDYLSFNYVMDIGKTYVIQSEVKDYVLKLYVYEKGEEKGEAVYTINNADWPMNISSSATEGVIRVEAYDNLETYEYDKMTGDLLGDFEGIEDYMKNQFTLIDPDTLKLPVYCLEGLDTRLFLNNPEEITGEIELPVQIVPDIVSADLEPELSMPVPGTTHDFSVLNQQIKTTIQDIGEIWLITNKYYIRETPEGAFITHKLYDDKYLINTYMETDGTFVEYEYDTEYNPSGYIKTLPNDDIEIYNTSGKLIEKKIPDPDFIKGVNLPWSNYGYDLGKKPGSDYWIGYTPRKELLYEKLAERKGDHIRLFLFCDLRSGMNFAGDGTPLSFTDKTFEDMRTLLEAAKTFNIKLMPTLFDYGIADGKTYENSYKVGEHSDIITDSAKKQALLNIFDTFFEEFADNPNIYAWDIINEPEYSTAVPIADMKSFVTDFASLIHSKAPEALVTVGNKDRQSLIDNWTDIDLDFYQYHYYDYFGGNIPLDYPAKDMNLNKPVIAGELEPTSLTDKLNTLKTNGYNGGLFWEDGTGFTISDSSYQEIQDWFSGTRILYDYYESGRLKTTNSSDGTVREFEDKEVYGDGNGRLTKESFAASAYKLYEYHGETIIPHIVNYYLSTEILFMKEEYSESGEWQTTSIYYENGILKEITRRDNTWEKYNEAGEFLRRGENINGINVIYDINDRIVKLIDGNYIEERQYVFAEGEIQNTLAFNDGMIKAVKDNYYIGTEIISRLPGAGTEQGITVTYDNNMTVNYVDGNVNTLSVEDGYVNFYNGTDVAQQNSLRGDLYDFEGNFLRKIATVNGNVYTFDTVTDAAGTTVTLSSAVINGTKCEFADANLSSITVEGSPIAVTELIISNNLIIETLKINRGSGEETLTRDDPVFSQIYELLHIINSDVPNIRFYYTSDMEIESIVTGDYSRVEFENDLITRTVSAEGGEVTYDYIREGENITGLRMLESGIIRTFDNAGKLLSIDFEKDGENTSLTFENEELASISSGGSIIENIIFDDKGDIDSAKLIEADGSQYFFSGIKYEEFTNLQKVEYELDARGKIARIIHKDTGEIFEAAYAVDPDDGKELSIFTSVQNDITYTYKDEVLIIIDDPSGLTVNYGYDDEERVAKMNMLYGGVKNTSYIYEYNGSDTIITDDIGNKRTFNSGNKVVQMDTVYGDTYIYEYTQDEETGSPITVVNYTYKVKEDGTKIEYFAGKIQKITRPDRSWIDEIEFDAETGELKKFTLNKGVKRIKALIEGDLIQYEMKNLSRFIFKDNKLIAFGTSQGITPLSDDVEELNSFLDKISQDDVSEELDEKIDFTAANWRAQGYYNSRAITSVERNYAENRWEAKVNLITGDAARSQGEMYLDLRYGIPGISKQRPLDLSGKEISFKVRPDYPRWEDDFGYMMDWLNWKFSGTVTKSIQNGCSVQVFAKDERWRTQYGTKVALQTSGIWTKASLVLTDGNINMGFTNTNFDPTKIVMIGLRILQPEYAAEGLKFKGRLLIKHDAIPGTIFEKAYFKESLMDDLYYKTGITNNVDFIDSNFEVTKEEEILRSFTDALENGFSDKELEDIFSDLNWDVGSPNMSEGSMGGIKSVSKDPYLNEYILEARLNPAHGYLGEKEGKAYFDVRKDIPGISLITEENFVSIGGIFGGMFGYYIEGSTPVWGDLFNLTSRKISMLIKVPEGMIGNEEAPNGARIFVEDENGYMQYGTWVNLKEAGKWYKLELTPTFGTVAGGFTVLGFDPSKIAKIGVNVSTQEGSDTDFTGKIRLKFLPTTEDIDPHEIVDMPLWVDLRDFKEYLEDQTGTDIKLPAVNYLSSDHFDSIFTGEAEYESLINFDAIESANTSWKVQGGGVTNIGWRKTGLLLPTGNKLIADINIGGIYQKGEGLLDLRYSRFVPEKSWQDYQFLDMTQQEIVFYIRAVGGSTASSETPLCLQSWVKDYRWKTEHSTETTLYTTGEWTKIVLRPTDPYAYDGEVDYGFNPEKIAALGFKVKANSAGSTYSGKIEIKYEINSLGEQTYDFSQASVSKPVLVNQQDFAKYLKDKGISLYGFHTSLDEIKQLIEDIPEFSLSKGFSAYTVYDEDDKISYSIKPDGTTSWYDENGNIDYVSFEDGSIFMDYEYDNLSGELTDAVLVNARNELERSFTETVLELEAKTTDTLMVMAKQKEFLNDKFARDVERQRGIFANERARLQAMRYRIFKKKILWWVKKTRVEVPGVAGAISRLNEQEAEFNKYAAEQLAELNDELMAQRESIGSESKKILDEYEWQNRKVLVSIRREEMIPILQHYYRDIIGRDINETEVLGIFRRLDSNEDFAGIFKEEFFNVTDIVDALKENTQTPIYTNLSDETRAFIGSFSETAVVEKDSLNKLAADLDKLLRVYSLYNDLSLYYGSESMLRSKLSNNTIVYAEGMTCLSKNIDDLTDADKTEIQWLNRYILEDILKGITAKNRNEIFFDAKTLKRELSGSTEHSDRTAFKETVTKYIMTFFNEFAINPDSQASLLAELGLTRDEIIDFDTNFRVMLRNWLENQDLHFGISAFGALAEMLNEKGADVSLEEVAGEALLMDLLLGITGPFMDEKIEISMYTMSRVAKLHGVTASSARLDYDDILNINAPFITLINEHHYVTVLSVTDTEVTYWDQNIGANGGETTVNRKSFEGDWQGNVITDSPVDVQKLLTDTEAKNIKGAFLGIIIAIVSFVVAAVAPIITTAIAIIQAVVLPLITLVANIAMGLAVGVANVLGIIASAGSALLSGLGLTTGFSLTSLVSTAATTLVKVGVSYGVSMGLEALGVDPLVSGLVASVVTGGVHGFLSGEGMAAVFRSALQFGSQTAMSMLGQHLDFAPVITNLLSISTGIFAGAGFDIGTGLDPQATFTDALQTVTTNVTAELTGYGVQLAGQAIGLPTELTYLSSLTISSSLRAGLSNIGGGGSPNDWIDGAINGLTRGVTKIGIDYAVEEMDIDPLLANIGASVIGSFLESQMSFSENMTDGEKLMKADELYNKKLSEIIGGPVRPAKGMYDKATYRSKLSDYYWQEAVHAQTIQQVSTAIRENGIESALNSYATSVFNNLAIRTIINAAKISIDKIGSFVKEKIDAFKADSIKTDEVTINEKGEYELKIKDESGKVAFKMTLKEMMESGYYDFILTGHEIPGKYIINQTYGLENNLYGRGYDENGSYTVYLEDISGLNSFSRKDINKSVTFNHMDTGRIVTIKPVYDELGIMITHYEVELNSANSVYNTAPETKITYYFEKDKLVMTDEKNDVEIGSSSTNRFWIEDLVMKNTIEKKESLKRITRDKYTGWYYDKKTGKYIDVEYNIAGDGKITTEVNGKTEKLGDINDYIVRAGPIHIELKNGAKIPKDGFGLNDLQKLAMTHSGKNDKTHDFIQSIDITVKRVNIEDVPDSNKTGYMTTGTSTNEVDIASLNIKNNPGLEKSTRTITEGVLTDINWTGAIDPGKKVVDIIVDLDKGGTIKKDNVINWAGVQANGREIRLGTENSWLFVGDSASRISENSKYVETEREIRVGDLKYKIIARAYIDASGTKITSKTLTTVIRSDNTFLTIENEITSKLGVDFDVEAETYAEVSSKLALKVGGQPLSVVEAMYKDLYEFVGGS